MSRQKSPLPVTSVEGLRAFNEYRELQAETRRLGMNRPPGWGERKVKAKVKVKKRRPADLMALIEKLKGAATRE